MKTDSLFYRIFRYAPTLFFALIDQPAATARAYKFDSIEIKQTAFRLDGVFVPKAKRSDRPIYFVEAQLQRDRKFYWRFFAEVGLFLRQETPKQDWRGVVIWGKRSHDPGVPNHWREFVQSQRVQIIYLDELASDEADLNTKVFQLLVAKQRQSIPQAREIMTLLKPPIVTGDLQSELVDLIETILVYKFPNRTKEEIIAMLGTDDLKKTRFYKDVFAEGQEEGREQGQEEGREQGREEIQQKGVVELLKLGLAAEQIARSLSLPLATTKKMIQAAKRKS
jgi:predicted transposase/invertase (TIGR01784 family)